MTVDLGVIVSVVCSLASLIGVVAYVSSKMGRLEFQVTELWEFRDNFANFSVRRAATDAINSGIGKRNSPFSFSPNVLERLEPIQDELRSLYQSMASDKALNDLKLFMEIDLKFGPRLLELLDGVSDSPLSQGEMLLIATAVAKNRTSLNIYEDEDTE